MRSAFVLLFFTATIALAACGGGSGSGSIPATTNPTAGSAGPSAAMTFRFPAPSTASSARAPKYLSPNTTSVTITITAVNGVPPNPAIPPTTIAVAPGQGSCSAVVNGGFSCTATVGAVAGTDTFLIQAYDSSGTLLSSGSITVAVNPTGTTTVTTPLVLGGVSAAASVATPSPGVQTDGSAFNAAQSTWVPPADGTSRTLTLSISAKDASGSTIVGPLSTPIPIALTDPSSGTLSYSASPSANVSGANVTAVPTTITLHYSGASFYGAGTPTSGTLKIGSGSSTTTIAIAPLQVATSITLANATVGIPFTVTATEAGVSGATFAATATSGGGTLQAACAPSPPPASGATNLTCNATSGSVTFDVAPSGLGTGGSLAISDANAVSVKQSFDVTPQTGGGITVPPHTVADYTVFSPQPAPAPSPNINMLLGLSVGPNGTHIYFAESNFGKIGMFTPSSCIPGNATSCGIQSVPISIASPFPADPLYITATNGTLFFDDDTTNGVYTATCSATACSATHAGSGLSAPGPFTVGTSGLVNFEFSGVPQIYQTIGAGWVALNPSINTLSQATIGFSGEPTATGASSGVAYLESVVGSNALPTNFTTLTYCSNTSQHSTDTGTIALDGLALGSDGNLWVVEKDRRYIAAISPATCILGEYPLPALSGSPPTFPSPYIKQAYTVVPGPDGNLWVTDPANNSIDRVTTAGVATAFPIPTAAADPFDLIVGPDGNLWFTEAATLKIGEVVLQ
ncbi:MAG: virginiamycin B lyase family protein [Candidatus Baltobacteraceae bacterium]